jgi:hypothetical protein
VCPLKPNAIVHPSGSLQLRCVTRNKNAVRSECNCWFGATASPQPLLDELCWPEPRRQNHNGLGFPVVHQ